MLIAAARHAMIALTILMEYRGGLPRLGAKYGICCDYGPPEIQLPCVKKIAGFCFYISFG